MTPKLYTLPSKSPVWIQGQVIDIGSFFLIYFSFFIFYFLFMILFSLISCSHIIMIGSIHTKVEMRMIPPETRICVTLFVAKEVKRKKKTEFFFGKDREKFFF